MTDNEKNASIDYILSRGLSKPKSLRESFSEMLKALGLRTIFFDLSPALLLTVLTVAGFVAVTASRLPIYVNDLLFAAAFAVSPMLFVCLTLFTELIERTDGIYELKMTAKYTLRHITAFRVLCFSLPCMLFSVITSAAFCYALDVSRFFSVLSLSMCALFLYAFVTVFILRKFSRRWFAPAIVWMVFGVLPQFVFGTAWEHFLSQLPAAVTLGVAALAFALYLWEIKKLMNRSYNYAYGQ